MPNYQRTAIHSIDDLKAVANHAGSFFFSPGALKFFNSHILSDVWAVDGAETHEGARFIFLTSEQYPYQPRHYAVRMMTLQSIRTGGRFNSLHLPSDMHPRHNWRYVAPREFECTKCSATLGMRL